MLVRSINELPDEVLEHIMGFLPTRNLGVVPRVCKLWRAAANDDLLWAHQLRKVMGKSVAEGDAPRPGTWKQYYILNFWNRGFDRDRHHKEISVENHGRAACVPAGSSNRGYKGILMTPEFPKTGSCYIELNIEFLDDKDTSDHISLGVASKAFNTSKDCPEGWNDDNLGCGWYSSNGAVYMAGGHQRVGGAGVSNSVIKSGDRIGLKLDRDAGALSFYLNGELQPVGASGELYKETELYCSVILMHDVRVSVAKITTAAPSKKRSVSQYISPFSPTRAVSTAEFGHGICADPPTPRSEKSRCSIM
jgi:hypothetical protein